jgi:hypothetical protein
VFTLPRHPHLRSLVAIFGFATLASCTPSTAEISNALAVIPSNPTIVTCDSGCVPQWQRAQIWLANHSVMKVQTATDALLQTYNVPGYEPNYSFSVIKEPQQVAGQYRISMTMACGNPLGCAPSEAQVLQSFSHYVRTGTDVLAGNVRAGLSIRE